MFKQALNRIKAHIEATNPYFQHGFAAAWQDEETGGIFARDRSELASIFPSDRLGDYFYLRDEKTAAIAGGPQHSTGGCCPDGGATLTGSVHLVAIVRKADADVLAENLINALALHTDDAISLTSVLWNREDVTEREMERANKEDFFAALQRLTDETIVSITFSLSVEMDFRAADCFPNPCSTC